MFHTYILQSEKTGNYYIGSTANLEDRLIRHNSGRSKATKSGMPWRMVYTEDFQARSDAMKRECELKSWKSHKRVAKLIQAKQTP